jgi:lipopolysaccharide/colanic/teichoic acid biosynthesis glycosyltransferase
MNHEPRPLSQTFYCGIGKRWFDAAAALAGLVVLSPLFLLVAIAIKMTGRGPVFFRQVRVGQFGMEFRIFKFRSMTSTQGQQGPLLTASGDTRITPVGRWLRKTKIDELPQLLNVVFGEMSLVGPRPEVPRYIAGYTDRQKLIFLTRPGVTGPTANSYIQEEEILAAHADKESFYLKVLLPAKLEMDLVYCKEVSFLQDLKLMFTTFAKIFVRITAMEKPLRNASQKQT